ncbi:MAG: hypothetical protein BGO70_14065 [Bacteroidetes bacterium 43-93]|nr:TolC family protein [Bacteroidota bacterium]OJW99556.1 MAG: hypothetical protein BGO70_14065 [Bacteroidetes bacterium 43-93]
MLKKMLTRGIYLCYCICILQPAISRAQTEQTDTLALDIQQVEKLFMDKNLELVARQYGIEADKALIQQAKLWNNPILNTDQNVYSNNKWFEHGTNPATNSPYGQYYVQLQQLIQTAGKRGKQIKLARTNAEISEWEFKDLMRNLRYELHIDFYTLAQTIAAQDLYNKELEQINKLMAGMTAEYNLGNISKKDLLRVQALQIGLQQDATENGKKLDDTQAELKSMLQLSGNVVIKPLLGNLTLPQLPGMSISDMMDMAKANNSTYHLEQLQVKYKQQSLAYQKALAVPDVTLGPNFDKNSNYTPNYVGLGISLPLPVFDRNQGNIKAARWQLKAEEANMQLADVELSNNVVSAYNKLKNTLQLNANIPSGFYEDYGTLFNKVVQSYRDRQISMVEFIDYFDTYKDAMQKQTQQLLNVQLAKDELNTQIGTDIVQ